MLSWMKTRAERRRTATEQYGVVVAQARHAYFYGTSGVADTPEGRYEMIVAHMALVIDRLGAGGEPAKALARDLAERFVTDMDDAMREMGVGDMSVPRKVKKAAGGLYDRTLAYRAALSAADDAALCALLAAHVPGLDAATPEALRRLAAYLRSAAATLAAQPDATLLDGRAAFPDPSAGDEPSDAARAQRHP